MTPSATATPEKTTAPRSGTPPITSDHTNAVTIDESPSTHPRSSV
jgi:hypothetical protein